jgi:hypothetical protein
MKDRKIPKTTQLSEIKFLSFFQNGGFVVKNYLFILKIVLLISSSVIFPSLEKTLLPEESRMMV